MIFSMYQNQSNLSKKTWQKYRTNSQTRIKQNKVTIVLDTTLTCGVIVRIKTIVIGGIGPIVRLFAIPQFDSYFRCGNFRVKLSWFATRFNVSFSWDKNHGLMTTLLRQSPDFLVCFYNKTERIPINKFR